MEETAGRPQGRPGNPDGPQRSAAAMQYDYRARLAATRLTPAEIAAMQERHRDLVLERELRQQDIARLAARNRDRPRQDAAD
jgi:hypothetical protein